MLKKDLYSNLYLLTIVVIAAAVGYYIFVFQKNVASAYQEDPSRILTASQQNALAQQMVKSAVGMGYAENEKQFIFFQNQLKRTLPEWKKGYKALVAGDVDLGITKPTNTETYSSLQDEIRFTQLDIENNVSSLIELKFTKNKADANYIGLRRSIQILVNSGSEYERNSIEITKYFVDDAQTRSSSYLLAEITAFVLFIGLIIIQGLFIFRPLVKLAGDNYLSANKAFVKVQNSEKQLKINYHKQKIINKKLYQSTKELESKNSQLIESESKLKNISDDQIKVNEKLLNAQDELNKAYRRLQDSELEIRNLADKQLQDNEKLFLAEKKMKTLLENEKRANQKLEETLNSLKSAQS